MEQNLPAKDYKPRSTLILKENIPQKPYCPVINVHTHVARKISKPEDVKKRIDSRFKRALGGDNPISRDFLSQSASSMPLEEAVKTMDNLDIEYCVDLDGFLPMEEHDKLFGQFRDRFILFHVLMIDEFDDPDFSLKCTDELERAVEKGARGLKVHKSLGLVNRDGSGQLIPINHLKLDPVWDKAGKLGIPVLIHCADPAPYFMPVDRYNPCYAKLVTHPLRSYMGDDFPAKQEILNQRNDCIARHPGTIFIGAHHGNCAEDLDYVASLLDKHNNFYVEMSYALVPLGLQPYTCRKHFIRYQDRIMFGTDGLPDDERYRMYFRFFETDDEYFETTNGAWRDFICGIKLPPDVLKKVYRENALKILPRF